MCRMGSSVSLQSGGARAAVEILADITAAGADAEQIKTLQAEMKIRLAEIHKALSTAENEEKKDLEKELAIAQGALMNVKNTNNNELDAEGNGGEGNGGEGNGGEGNGGEGNGGEGNGGEGNGGEGNTGATISNLNQDGTQDEPHNTKGENNDEKALTPEKCKELIESPPNVEDAKKKTEEEVPGFFSFLGNWKTIFESSYWQPTEDEKRRDKCKEILASQAVEGETAISAGNNNDRGLGNNNFTYNENAEKAAAAVPAPAVPAPAVPAPAAVPAAGGRRTTHKNREARRRTRKVADTESV